MESRCAENSLPSVPVCRSGGGVLARVRTNRVGLHASCEVTLHLAILEVVDDLLDVKLFADRGQLLHLAISTHGQLPKNVDWRLGLANLTTCDPVYCNKSVKFVVIIDRRYSLSISIFLTFMVSKSFSLYLFSNNELFR